MIEVVAIETIIIQISKRDIYLEINLQISTKRFWKNFSNHYLPKYEVDS